jgi:SAM-dependent methyltransferase
MSTHSSLIDRLRDRLADPRMASVDLESGGRIDVHRRILNEKRMLREVFEEMYGLCAALDQKYFWADGERVELGAGASLIKDFFPTTIVSDIEPAAHLDLVADAEALPLGAASVRAFYALDCFHHMKRPEDFFAELDRTLAPGGGCVLIEPYHGPVARLLFKRLFTSEGFDPSQPLWSASDRAMGSMRGANQALSQIVFSRDRRIFSARYPRLRVIVERPLTHYLRYLASGGLNFRPLLPSRAAPLLRALEWALQPLNRVLALHHVIVLRKER